MKKNLLLIDGHSILNRAYYALPLLTNAKGVYTNAVYGFLNIIFKVIDDVKPDHMAVAFDLSAPTFRHKMYDAYKGTRKPMPKELVSQVPLMKEVLLAMGVKILEKEGFEADDLLGSAAAEAEREGFTVNILSGDRDLLQLVSEKTTLILPRSSKGSTTVESFTPIRVKEVYQINPNQIVDLKAMMGDASDNIPGLPGIGEKTATNLLLKYETLENAHMHMDEIKPKKAFEAMRDHYDRAELSQKLATIKRNVEAIGKIEDFAIENLYTAQAYALYKELGFKNLFSRFQETDKAANEDIKIEWIEDLSASEKIFEEAEKEETAAFYLDMDGEKVIGLSLAFSQRTIYIAAQGFLTDTYLKEKLSKLIEKVKKPVTYKFKEEQNVLQTEEKKELFDCIIAAYLLDPLRAEYSYEYLAGEYAGKSLPSAEEIIGEKITKKTVISQEKRGRIAAYIAYTALICRKTMEEALKEKGMESLFTEIEMPFAYTLSEIEKSGIRMNTEELMEFSRQLSGELEKLEKKIYEEAGEEFNIQSPKQLGVILFEKMKLPGAKKTKSGYSTAVDVLEKLAEQAPIAKDILSYRQLAKLKSTYADALGGYVAEDGRIHSHFQQTVTATGRISSTDPNLQNIPVRMELGRKIRRVFTAKEGYVFIDADYSQIELRVLAHMSNDEKLIEAYNQESDIHRITASQVFEVPIEEVTAQQRRNAKAVNFGIVYGISSFGLSQDLSISRKEAQQYIQKYFETYPGIKEYLDHAVEEAKENGYTTTLYGRRRPIPELKSSNFMQRSFGERVAMNAPIQGTAADIIKIAMNNVEKRLKAEGCRAKMILQVHDELLLEAPKEEAEKVSILLREEMERAASLRVKLEVDLNIGSNWDECH